LSEMTIFLLPSARSDHGRSQHAVFRKVLDSICTIVNQTHLQLNTVTHKKTYDHKFNEMSLVST